MKMKKKLGTILFLFFAIANLFCVSFAQAILKPLAILERSGGGGGGGGTATAISLGSSGVVAAGSAAAFAPLLLAGLSPNCIITAAAPIGCIACKECYLQKAILEHFCMTDITTATSAMEQGSKIYFAQNDSSILNGTFDMQGIPLPEELLNAKEIRVNLTLYSDPYNEVKGLPELKIGLYKDIAQEDLRKKFETQQFTRYYLMKKYDIYLRPNVMAYDKGVQKLSANIDMSALKMKNVPLQVAMTFTKGGFQKNQAVENPKIATYAYLIEFEKVR